MTNFTLRLPIKKHQHFYFSLNDSWNLFHISIWNPFKTWWKARKFFKRPKTKIHFFWSKRRSLIPGPYVWTERYGKILDLYVSDLDWKDKYDSPRHERNPSIFFCLFRRFGFVIMPRVFRIDEFGDKKDGDTYYWEYLLNYTHYNRGLRLNGFWMSDSRLCFKYKYDDEYNIIGKTPYKYYIPTHLFSLNKRGLKAFKELMLNDKTRNNYNTESLE